MQCVNEMQVLKILSMVLQVQQVFLSNHCIWKVKTEKSDTSDDNFTFNIYCPHSGPRISITHLHKTTGYQEKSTVSVNCDFAGQ